MIRALKEVGYTGVWLYEIDYNCPKTIIRDRDLECEHFVRNAIEVLQNEPITIFQRRSPTSASGIKAKITDCVSVIFCF